MYVKSKNISNDIIKEWEIMTVAQLTFDTLAYANKLKQAGFEPRLAEAQTDAQVELLRDLAENQLATKQDIHDLKTKIEILENRLTIKLGTIVVAGIGLLATLLTIFHVH